jgi:hypothetical protein
MYVYVHMYVYVFYAQNWPSFFLKATESPHILDLQVETGELEVKVEVLESILWNRFGRNLQTKPNLLKFKFSILTLNGFKML